MADRFRCPNGHQWDQLTTTPAVCPNCGAAGTAVPAPGGSAPTPPPSPASVVAAPPPTSSPQPAVRSVPSLPVAPSVTAGAPSTPTPAPAITPNPGRGLTPAKSWTRWVLAVGCVVMLAYLLISFFGKKWNVEDPSYPVRDIQSNEFTKTAHEVRLENSRNFFQTAILIIGAIWGGILLARQLLLHDKPDLTMFLTANLLLGVSAYLHWEYVDIITYNYAIAAQAHLRELKQNQTLPAEQRKSAQEITASMPDVFDERYAYLYNNQVRFLIGGLTVTCALFLSAYLFRETL